jgi:hypothetical protein
MLAPCRGFIEFRGKALCDKRFVRHLDSEFDCDLVKHVLSVKVLVRRFVWTGRGSHRFLLLESRLLVTAHVKREHSRYDKTQEDASEPYSRATRTDHLDLGEEVRLGA